MEKTRQSNFELLRIITMSMIVFHHFALHSGFNFPIDSITVNKIWIQIILIGGKLGVNLFILVSGYFLISSSKFKISKVLKLWIQVFFYSILIYGIFVICGWEKFSIKNFIRNILPITFEQWWFASTYFVLYLLSPFINVFLNQLDRQTYQKMLMIMTICWCFIPTVTNSTFQSNNLIWFVYLYSIAGYIKLYKDNTEFPSKKCLALTLSLIVLTFSSVIVFDLLGRKVEFIGKYSTYFYGMQKLPILLISIFLFLGFKNTKMKYNKTINLISSATFGVYLIHENNLIRLFLWKNIFDGIAFSDTITLIPYSIIAVATVYIVCTIIELLRIYILEKNYMKVVEKIEFKINNFINEIMNSKFIKSF